MERCTRYLHLLVLLLWGMGHAAGQEITFNATVDRTTIAAGEPLRLTIALSNTQERFSAPDLGGLVIVQGPFENSSFNYINGRLSSSITRQWVLTATNPGKYTIGPAKVKVGGGMIQTDPITIEVGKGTSRPADANVAQGQRSDPNLFATIDLSRNKAHVGEQVTATYTLYTRYQSVELAKYDLPKLNGFWAEDIGQPQQGWEQRQETINGVAYRVAILKRQVLFPQRGGKLRIDPMKLTCVVNRSWLSAGTQLEISSNAVEFTAMDLPSGAPADFNGAVGEVQLVVKAERTKVKANEAVDLSVRISGRSNLKLLDAPKFDLPKDFETYDPKVVDKITVNASGMSGSREFQYLIIPRVEGSYELPPITMSYFDTKSGTYRTLQGAPITLEVEPGEGGSGVLVQRPMRSEVHELGKDIRYIRTGDLELRLQGSQLYGSTAWYTGIGAPPLAFLLFLVWHRKRKRAEADVEGSRRRGADRVARQRLKSAAKALQQNEREAFYSALGKALQGYLADKLGLGIARLTEQTLRERFSDLSDGHELASECTRLITTCDMARFAPVEDRPRQELYDQATNLIGRIERTFRA